MYAATVAGMDDVSIILSNHIQQLVCDGSREIRYLLGEMDNGGGQSQASLLYESGTVMFEEGIDDSASQSLGSRYRLAVFCSAL